MTKMEGVWTSWFFCFFVGPLDAGILILWKRSFWYFENSDVVFCWFASTFPPKHRWICVVDKKGGTKPRCFFKSGAMPSSSHNAFVWFCCSISSSIYKIVLFRRYKRLTVWGIGALKFSKWFNFHISALHHPISWDFHGGWGIVLLGPILENARRGNKNSACFFEDEGHARSVGWFLCKQKQCGNKGITKNNDKHYPYFGYNRKLLGELQLNWKTWWILGMVLWSENS